MEAPQPYKTAGLLNLIGGLFNALTGFVFCASFIWVCVGPFWLIPMGMGMYQLFIGVGMQGGKANGNAKMASIIGIVAGVLNMNPVPLILSVVAYMQLGDPEVAGF